MSCVLGGARIWIQIFPVESSLRENLKIDASGKLQAGVCWGEGVLRLGGLGFCFPK